MIFKEEKRDLFTMPKDYALAHCVSADFALGAGIAKEFDKRFNCRKRLLGLNFDSVKEWDCKNKKGDCIVTGFYDPYLIFNLVTKQNYWHKPTFETIENALVVMKDQCEFLGIKKVAMPKIACGLDGKQWSDVKPLIEKVFADTDVEIVVCSL